MTFRFLNGETILDENMLFWIRLYALVVVLKILNSISDYNGKNHMGFLKKSIAFGAPPAYSRYRRLRPGGEICWFGVNFPRDLKCQILSSLTVEIAFKRRKQAIKCQCWCGVNFPRDLKCQIPSSLSLEIAFKRRKETNIYIYIYIFFSFFPFKKSEQPQIVAFNRIVVNYNIHFFILFGVDNCKTGHKNMQWNSE